MGVPGFFSWLLKQHKTNNIILNSLDSSVRVDILYIDANCLFHPQCFKILKYFPDWTNEDNLHKKMITRILNYIDYLVGYVDPKKELVISVDGVAPMAKMNQQRLRRYRTIDDIIVRENLKRKYDKPVSNRWSNTVITPGTEFMELLHNAIIQHINKNKKLKVRYSSYHVPGEGEHKILDDIRTKVQNNSKDTYCIYGLDADLIFLSLASQKCDLYLLREENQLVKGKHVESECIDPLEDVAEELNFVSIDEMKRCFVIQFETLIKDKIEFQLDANNDKFINDFIFICYFLGNDFLPHLPSIDVNIGGLDIILDAYTNTFVKLQTNLIEINPEISINSIFLETFLEYISSREDYYFSKILPKFLEQNAKRRCPTSDPYEKELWDIDNLKTNEIIKAVKNDPIKLGVGKRNEWKFRYYEYYFNQKFNQKKLVDDMCFEFCKGLLWVSKYYFKGCCSWSWKYPYSNSPFISDIYHYIKDNKIDFNNITIEDQGYLKPCEQLLAVLPPICQHLLPASYKYLVSSFDSPIIYMYPEEIEINRLYKYKDFQCTPKIPQVNTELLRNAASKLTLTNVEKKRNKIENEITNK